MLRCSSARRGQGRAAELGLLRAALQGAQLRVRVGSLALGGDHCRLRAWRASLGVGQLRVQLFKAGLADGAALLQGFLLTVDLGQLGVDRSLALLAGSSWDCCAAARPAAGARGLGVAGLAAQHGEAAAWRR